MRKVLSFLGITALAAVTAMSCEDNLLFVLPPPEIQIDELKQKPAAEVDILWVVDNSQSMIEEQQSLAQNFDRFITGLTICQGSTDPNDTCNFETKRCRVSDNPCNPPDYHIGVISTDVVTQTDQGRLRRTGLCVPAARQAPANDEYTYCNPVNGNRDCTAPNATCDAEQGVTFITPTTRNAASAFEQAVQVGTGGSGLERGIQAAAQALGRDADRNSGQFKMPPSENQGFLRPNASLFIIFVSDEDDSSFGKISYFYRAFESLKGAGNEGLVSASAIVGDLDPDGPAGSRLGGCPTNVEQDQRTASAGTRYIGLAMYTRGLSSEFRVCDDKRLTCPAESSCQKPLPGFPTEDSPLGICVPTTTCQTDQDCGNFKCGTDGNETGCIVCENTQCVAKSDRFLDLLQRNGIFGSICAPDYGVVLGALGFEAAGLSRKFELTKPPNCVEQVPCPDEQNTQPVCVKVEGNVIANDRATGWVWEPSSNAVFFDGSFVPPTDAPIEISYRTADGDVALSCDTALK